MITIIKGGSGTGKTRKLVEIANKESIDFKKVLIITLFNTELPGLLTNDNIIIVLSSDENLQELMRNADIIMIDDTPFVLAENRVDLGVLVSLNKEIYYTIQILDPKIPYDNIIEVNWESSEVSLYKKSSKVYPKCRPDETITLYLIKTITGNNHLFVDEYPVMDKGCKILKFEKSVDVGKVSIINVDVESRFEMTVKNEDTLIPLTAVEVIKTYEIFKDRLVY